LRLQQQECASGSCGRRCWQQMLLQL
jgi:hypothetical protein